MSVFDRMKPIVNPRRYLKKVDKMKKLYTDEQIKGMVTPIKYDETPKEQGIVPTGLEGFLGRLFATLKSVRRHQLVQSMDDGEHTTYGIFVQSNRLRGFPEYRGLTPRDKRVADEIISLWKRTEEDMRVYCIHRFQQNFAVASMPNPDAIQEFAEAMRNAERIVEKNTNILTRSRTAAFDINSAFTTLSEKYMNLLEQSMSVELGMAIFLINVQSVLHRECSNLSVLDIAGFNIQFPIAIGNLIYTTDRSYADMMTAMTNIDLRDFIRLNQKTIREWFVGLKMIDFRAAA